MWARGRGNARERRLLRYFWGEGERSSEVEVIVGDLHGVLWQDVARTGWPVLNFSSSTQTVRRRHRKEAGSGRR